MWPNQLPSETLTKYCHRKSLGNGRERERERERGGREGGREQEEQGKVKILVYYSNSLEESGQTALGPAVLVSVVIASQVPGSKVLHISHDCHMTSLLSGHYMYGWAGQHWSRRTRR